MKGYSTREVSELLDLPEAVIRDVARGILDPDRGSNQHFRFSFQDIVVLRTAKELLHSGVQRSKINRSLFELQRQLPSNRPLTALRISGDGGVVVASIGAGIQSSKRSNSFQFCHLRSCWHSCTTRPQSSRGCGVQRPVNERRLV